MPPGVAGVAAAVGASAAVVAEQSMLALTVEAVITELAQPLVEPGIVRHHHAAVTETTERLGRIEAQGARVTETAGLPLTEPRA